MANTGFIGSSDTTAIGTTAATSQFWPISGTLGASTTAVETETQAVIRSPGTFHDMYVRVTSNTATGTNTMNFRNNAGGTATNQTINFGGTTGTFQDSTHTDAVVPGDKVNYNTPANSTGSTTFTIDSILFDSTTNFVTRQITNANRSYTTGAAFNMICGRHAAASSETGINTLTKKACIIQNMQINLRTNGKTSTWTLRSRKNSVNGAIAITVPTGTGISENTTNVDSLVAGDNWDESFTVGTDTGNSCSISLISTEYRTDTGNFFLCQTGADADVAGTASATRYTGLVGHLAFTATESAVQSAALGAFVYSNLTIHQTVASTNTGTCKFRKGGLDGNQSATFGTTAGNYEDSLHTDSTVSTDLVCKSVTCGASTAGSFSKINVWGNFSPSLTRVTQADTLAYSLLKQVTQSDTLKYNLIGRVIQSDTLKYNVLKQVKQPDTLKYNVLRQVKQPNTLKYNLIGRILHANTLKYNLIGRIKKSNTLKYNLIGRITHQNTLKYNLIGRIKHSNTLNYNLLKQIKQSNTLKYNLLKTILKANTLKYNIAKQVIHAYTLKYNILKQIRQFNTLKYNLIGRIVHPNTLKYNLLKQIKQQNTLKYSLIGRILHANTLKYSLLKQIKQSNTLKYNLIGRIIHANTLKYSLLKQIKQSNTLKYNLLKQIKKANTLKYALLKQITKSNTLLWSLFGVLSRILHANTLKYSLIGRVKQQNTLKYNILKQIRSLITWDDFESGTYNFTEGAASPNGKWVNQYLGGTGATSGVRFSATAGSNVMYEKPQVSASSGESHATFNLATPTWGDFDLTLRQRTISQLRTGSAPNAWETAWILFHYTDPWHHYYLVFKTTGVELGRKDYATPQEQQIFLATPSSPTLTIGNWDTVRIKAVRNHFTVWINGTQVIDMTDDGSVGFDTATSGLPAAPSTAMYNGQIGLYNEDAEVEFDNVQTVPTLKYNIRKQILANRTLKYSILKQVKKQATLLWSLLAQLSRILHANTLKYSLIGRVTHQNTLKYNILKQILANRTLKYSILKQVLANRTLKYSLIGRIVHANVLKYSVLKQVITSRTLKYNLIGRIITSRTLKYSVLKQILTSRTLKYSLLKQVVHSNTLLWNIFAQLSRIVHANTLKYSLIGRILHQNTLKYNILVKRVNSNTLKYSLLKQIKQSRTLKYNLLQQIRHQNTLKYSLLQRIKGSRTAVYSIFKQIKQPRTLKYNLIQRIRKQITLRYNVISFFTRIYHSLTLRWHLLAGQVPGKGGGFIYPKLRQILYPVYAPAEMRRIERRRKLRLYEPLAVIPAFSITSNQVIAPFVITDINNGVSVKFAVSPRFKANNAVIFSGAALRIEQARNPRNRTIAKFVMAPESVSKALDVSSDKLARIAKLSKVNKVLRLWLMARELLQRD